MKCALGSFATLWTASRLSALGLLLIASSANAQNPPVTPPGQPAAPPQQGRGGGGRGGRGPIRIMTLTSTAFTDGGMIPAKYAQPGRDVSPALSWTGAPDSVVSYVLIAHDADAAIGNGMDDALHWMVWGIPGSMTSIPEYAPQGPTFQVNGASLRQLSVSGPYYRGPAAPNSGPAHHYAFELYALDVNINVQAQGQQTAPTRAAVLQAMENHIRGKAVLVGLFRRSDPPQP